VVAKNQAVVLSEEMVEMRTVVIAPVRWLLLLLFKLKILRGDDDETTVQ
jgi:hypothetical protein